MAAFWSAMRARGYKHKAERLAVAAITASLHAAVLIAAGLQIIPTARPERRIAIVDATTELRRPLIVTGISVCRQFKLTPCRIRVD